MLSLNHEDGQTPGELAVRLGVRPPTITKTINRLQVQGFLDKRASETDARQAHIFLTDTGRDAIRAIDKSVRKTEKQALKGLDKKEQKLLARLLVAHRGQPFRRRLCRDRRRRRRRRIVWLSRFSRLRPFAGLPCAPHGTTRRATRPSDFP